MEEEKITMVPYVVHEGSMARQERSNKRMFIALVVAILVCFITNGIWLWFFSQYEFVGCSYEYSQDGEGVNIIGEGNSANYGTEGDYPQTSSAEEETDG